nr:hypothetical protein [Tanacetum cinerariifolium]
MTTLTSMCEMVCQIFQKKQEEKRIEEEQAANARYWKIPACCDDDDDYNFAITLVLSTEETENSLSMGDEHLDTISATESDEVIKSSVENLVLIPSESEGIPDTMCDVHLEPVDSLSMEDEHLDTIPATESDEVIKSSVENLVPIPSEFEGIPNTMCDVHPVNNPTPLETKDHFEIVMNSNDDISYNDHDSLYIENIENLPDPGELMSILNSRIGENSSTTCVNLPVEDDQSPLLAYVVWIFLAYLTCAKCGHPVNGPYCQGCTLLREKLEEDLVTYFQNFQNTFESYDDSTNVVNAPREPVVVKQDHGVNPPHIDKCCCECGNALDGIFCQQCTCKCCGKGAHVGYNCPPKVSIISNPKPCNQTMNNELPQTLPSFDPTCYSDKENSVPCVSKPNFVNASSYIFNPPPQPPIYSCKFYGSNAQYGHYCTPQAPFNNPEPEEQAANARYWKIPTCCDDDDDYNFAITPVLSTEEPVDSLSMGDEHLDTIPATESDEVIKSSVENLVSIPSEFKGIPNTMCDVHPVNNPTPLEAKDHFEIVMNSNDDISSNDDDSLYNENIEYVEASPHNFELVSLEAAEILILKVEEIEEDNLREKLLNVILLIANIEALKDDPTQSSEFLTKSSSTSPKSFLDETNTFHNSLPEFENFYFDLEEISSGSTTTHSDISLLDYEAFYFDDDHIKEISGGSTTTHSDISLFEYDSFIFDFSNDQFPPTDRSDFTDEEFADELAHIISLPEYDCFYFRNFPDPVVQYSRKFEDSCQRILSSKSSFPQLQLGI